METISDSLDKDIAIMLITTPLWIAGFLYLIVAGYINDYVK